MVAGAGTSLVVGIGKQAALKIVGRTVRPFINRELETRFQLFVNGLAVSAPEAEKILEEQPDRAYELLERVRTAFTKEAVPVLARLLVDYRGEEPDAFYFQAAQILPQISPPELTFLRVFFFVASKMHEPTLSRGGSDHPGALVGDVRSPRFVLPSDGFAVRVFGLLTQQSVVAATGSKRLDDAAIKRWNGLLNVQPPPKPDWVTGEAGSYWKSGDT